RPSATAPGVAGGGSMRAPGGRSFDEAELGNNSFNNSRGGGGGGGGRRRSRWGAPGPSLGGWTRTASPAPQCQQQQRHDSLPSNLYIDVDHIDYGGGGSRSYHGSRRPSGGDGTEGGEWSTRAGGAERGASSSCDLQSASGIATSDGGFFCGPGGVMFPLRKQLSAGSTTGGSPNPKPSSHVDHSTTALSSALGSAAAADGHFAAWDPHGDGEGGRILYQNRARSPRQQRQQVQQQLRNLHQQGHNGWRLGLRQREVRSFVSRLGDRRHRQMGRCMTYPLVLGDEAEIQEDSLEALSLRSTETTEVSVRRVFPTTHIFSPGARGAASFGPEAEALWAAAARDRGGGFAPPRHPDRFGPQQWWTSGGRVAVHNLIRGESTRSLPSSISYAR
ncbi:unnamed protein product, partial [Ectocarpus fasciculatus]